ncbi:hypothetical protein C8J35_101714 [Rhizobium sp. PP-F2F-G38]|nr:hypothetical protein C8J37_101715 [Rhizobium sp. PP-WC-1G-195]PYF00893.1 hypothetical protein C8J35_101714 [Rhizobium sp. PP-F2F-G38]TCP90423.1 hypothetical protein C8J31_101262 [Rhizobium sp. PP-CC-2G-626]
MSAETVPASLAGALARLREDLETNLKNGAHTQHDQALQRPRAF